jgi:class 3 adenylate cyclase/ketosteroid isomerase-like protein
VAGGRLLAESLIGGRQGRLVLAYLTCERERAVRREELADLLWGEQPPDSWTTSLSAVISRLRRLFTEAGLDGAATLVSAPGAYQLLLPEGSRVDAEELVAAVGEAEDAAAGGHVDAALAAAARAEAIAARGFVTDDCEWVDSRRDTIRELRARAALAESAAQLAGDKSGRAIEAARRALELDETKEAAYRQLMLSLAAAGERAEALRVWERCRITLVEELGIDPSPETEAVYLGLLDATPAPAVTTALPSGVVTFLLTDIVDSSALWEEHAMAMAAALERHDALIGALVAAHGGTLLKSKLEGDATVSVFARASEGAAAALALLDAIDAEPWPEGARPRIRMAMHTGEAFERGGDYFGPALNRAARLRSLAVANEVLLSQAVAELVRDHLPDGVVLRERGLQDLRGLSRGENVFELTKTTATPREEALPVTFDDVIERPPVPAALAGSGPFVGRGGELAQLDDLWERAAASESSAVFVGGEPGVGKSRLAGEIAQRAYAAGGLVLYGRCDEDLAAPLQPFIEAVRLLAPALGSTRLRSIRGVDELTRMVPGLTDLLGETTGVRADPDTERLALFDAVTQLLVAASDDAPVLLVLDDLHWAGKTTLSLLRHLLRGTKGSRLLVVGTYRDTELARTHPLAETLADLRRDTDTHRVALGGLGSEDVAAYLAAIGNTDRALGRELAEVTAGNPFFLIEVVRHVEESGGSWQPGSLPEGVREATGRRLSRLSDAANDALAVAAVVGASFDLALVEQVKGVELVDTIAEAVQAGLVVEEPGSLARFRFAHALVRQVLLSELVSLKRVRLHRTIAELLEAAPPSVDPDARLADLAYHWYECASTGSADRAVAACRAAADRAVERLAYEEAGDLFGMALQALEWVDGADAEIAASLHLARCDALLTAGDVAGARDALDALEAAAAGSEWLAAWYTTYDGLLAVLGEPDRLTEIVQSIGAAAGAMRDVGDLRGEAKARFVHASALERLGQIGAAERAFDAALAAARNAGDRRLGDAILAEAPLAALWGPSPVTRASGRCLDLVRVLRITSGTGAVEAVALRCQAVLEALRGRMDAARRMIGSSTRTVEQLGLTHRRLEAELAAGLIELLDQQAIPAEEHLRDAYEGLRERGLGGEAAQAAAFLGRALLLQDRVDEADEMAAGAEALAGSDLKAAIAWRNVRAETASRSGDTARALALARESVDLANATDALLLVADARLTLAGVLRASGDLVAADAEARRAIDASEAKGATVLADLTRAAMGAPPVEPAVEETPTAMLPFGGRPLPNLAMASAIRFQEAFNRGDWDALWANQTTMQRVIDRRPIVGLTLYGDRQQAESVYAGGGRFDPPELVATRGERIALSRWALRTPDMEVPFLAITYLDAEGLLDAFVMFEPEAIDDAMAEIDAMASASAFENDATRAYRQMCDAFNAHDWDAVMAGIWDEYHTDDRRTVVGGRLDRAQSIENLRVVFDGRGTVESETVATRGVSLALTRATLHIPELEAGDTVLSLTVVDAELRRRTAIVFDADDLDDALAEMDRLYLEGEGAEHAEVIRVVNSFFAELPAERPAAALTRLTPDFRFRSHRAVRGIENEQDGAAFVAAVAPTMEAFRSGAARVDHVQDVSSRGGLWVLTVSGANEETGPFEVTYVMAVRVVDGRVSAIDAYDEHDVDAARAALALLSGSEARLFENDATRAQALLCAALNAHDWGAVTASLADDWTHADLRPALRISLDHEKSVESLRWLFDAHGEFVCETIATRGRSLALARTTMNVPALDAADTALVITRVDGSGRRHQSITLNADDLDTGLAELDRLFLEGEGAEHADVIALVASLLDALARHDTGASTAVLTHDFVVRSHRDFSLGDLGVEGWLRNVEAGNDVFGLSSLRVEHVARVSRAGGIWAIVMTGENSGGGAFEFPFLLAVRVAGQQICRVDIFNDRDGATAIAMLDEPPAIEWFENDATRATARVQAAYAARDLDAVIAVYADDWITEDRRAIVGSTMNIEQSRAQTRLIFDGGATLEREIVATRGRSLSLERWDLHLPDFEAHETVLLVTLVNAEGRYQLTVMFGVDDVDAAYAELDRLFLEGEGAQNADVIALGTSFFDALVQQDVHVVASLLADDFAVRSYRAFRASDHQTAAEFLADLEAGFEQLGPGAPRIEHVTRVSSAGGAWFVVFTGRDADGGPYEMPWLMVLHFAGGKIAALEGYDEEDARSALAALDAGRRPVEDVVAEWSQNEAWRAAERLRDAANRRDLEALLDTLDPEYVNPDHRPVVRLHSTTTSARDAYRTLFTLDEFRFERELLATRGERLALSRELIWMVDGVSGPSEVETVSVLESGPSGRLISVTMFGPDDVTAALDLLDARYVEMGQGDLGMMRRSFDARDWGTFATLFAPDCTIGDYRNAGWGDVDRDTFVDYQRSIVALAPDTHLWIDHTRARNGVVLSTGRAFGTHDGAPFEISFVTVGVVGPDGASRHFESYELADFELVQRRFDELAGEHSEGHVAENLMSRTLQQSCAALNRRDWQAFIDFHAPGFVFNDDRPGIRVRQEGEAALDTYAMLLAFKEFTWERTPIATRGERLVLTRNRAWWIVGESGPSEIESVSMLECNGDGLIVSETGVDPSELDAAYAAVDARHAELLAEEKGNSAWRAALRVDDATSRRDWEALTATLAPGFVHAEALNQLVRHGDDALAAYRVLFTLDEYSTRRTLVATRGDRLALMRVLTTLHDGVSGPAEFDAFTVCEVNDDGLLVRIDTHLPDERIAYAMLDARHAELLADAEGNAAWRAARHMWDALNRRDWHDFTAVLAADFVHVEEHHHLRLEGDDALSPFRVMFTLDECRGELTLVAARGERLALVRSLVTIRDRQAGVSEIDTFTIYEVDDDGRVSRTVGFAPDERAAYAALESRHAELKTEGNAAWRVAAAAADAMNRRDWTGFTALLHPDITYIDHHHSLHQGGDAALGTYRVLFTLAEYRFDRSLVDTKGDQLALIRDFVTFRDGDAGPAEVEAYNIYEIDADGLVILIEGYSPDELDSARRALEARAAALEPRPNAASRLAALHDEAFARRDWDAVAAVYAPNFVLEDRRHFVGRLYDAYASLETVRYAFDLEAIRWERRVVATRGERLALLHDLVSGIDIGVDFDMETLTLLQLDRDGLAERHTAFDADDLQLALAELDTRSATLEL